MRPSNYTFVAAALLYVSLHSVRADAAYIVYEFDGVFAKARFDGPVVPIDSPFTGLFSVEESIEGIDEPFNGGVESYYAPIYVELTVGTETISSMLGQAEVRDAVTMFNDNLTVLAGYEVGAPFSATLNHNEIRLFSLSLGGWQDTFSSSEYPRSLDLADFQSGILNVISGPLDATLLSGSNRGGVENLMEFTISAGRICSTPTCAIPEPNALLLGFAAALSALGVYWARRRVLSRAEAVRAMTA